MKKTSLRFDKDASQAVKGIAILLMLFHHFPFSDVISMKARH